MARLRLLLLGLLAGACGPDAMDCVPPPCPVPLAITIDVTSSAGGPIADVTVRTSGASMSTGPCTPGASSSTCRVLGGSGTYDLEITAPGFETARLTITVPGTPAPACGCPTVVTQHADVALAPS